MVVELKSSSRYEIFLIMYGFYQVSEIFFSYYSEVTRSLIL